MLTRRQLVNATLSAGLLPMAAPIRAQSFPQRPLRMLNGFAPGGAVDTVARLYAERLGPALGQTVVVENRPGAAGMIAAEAVARASPDGYTLALLDMGALAVNPALQPKVPYDVTKDFSFLGVVARVPLMLVVHPSMPATSSAALVRELQGKPGRYAYASAGIGSPPHLAMEAFKKLTGSFVVHIPYRGAAPAVQDVLAGRVNMMFIDQNTAAPHLKAGSLKAVAIATERRQPGLPDVPTFGESGIVGLMATPWLGVVAQSGVPADVAQRLQHAVRDTSARPDTQARIEQLGFVPETGSPETLAKLVRDDGNAWRQLIRDMQIRLE
jgi:tripartite-type tricarboxylate transporter receptor subunit TctC